jgi:hypothetical protein
LHRLFRIGHKKTGCALQHFADQAIIAPLQMHQHGMSLRQCASIQCIRSNPSLQKEVAM